MDTFGRLPNDVINEITKFNDVLNVIIEDKGNQQIYMMLKTLHYQCKFQCMVPLTNIYGVDMCNKADLEKIKIMINNKFGKYIQQWDDELFVISITEKDITISTPEVTMTLPIIHLDDFIIGLQKLYNLLDTYPKY